MIYPYLLVVRLYCFGGAHNDFMGDVKLDCVVNSNMLASRFTLCSGLAVAIDVFFAVEQPQSSVLESYPRMKGLLGKVRSFQRRFWMGKYGHFSPKASIAFGSWPASQCFRAGVTGGIL